MMLVDMICGYPASGKSTITREIVENTGANILNRDSIGGSINDLLPLLEQHLKDKKSVVLDNLFPTIDSRKPFIELCKKYNTKISCYVMGTSIEDAQFNAVQRAINILGKFPTPEEIKKAKHPNIFPPAVLFKYKKEYQKPEITEGFSSVFYAKFERHHDSSFTNKAIIVDYDGTVRECRGGNEKFPVSEDQVEIKPNVAKVLQSYKDKGYLLLGLSNQSGIHKGELAHDKAVQLFDYTNKQLDIDIEYQFCPHQSAPISCYCRKPMPGKGVEFIMKHKLRAKDCIMVGDMTTDATFAKRSGFQYVDQAEFFK